MKQLKPVMATVLAVGCALIWRDDIRAAAATYSYDELGRLTAVLNDDNTGETYAYDKAGNRASTYVGSPSIFTTPATLNVSEGSLANISIARAGNASTTVSVQYKTVNTASAVVGTNYTATSDPGPTTSFTTGQNSKSVSVATQNDGVFNSSLDFIVRLENPSSNAALGTGSGDTKVTILNTNPAPVFSISASPAVNEGGSITFTVTKTNATALVHAVNYATSSGSATQGTDYTGASGTLTFATGDTSKTFTVNTISDSIYEATETFAATLSAATNGAVLGTSTATGAINNYGTSPPSFSVNSPTAIVESQPITFTVTRTGGSGSTHNISYATANGTAIAGTNYTATSGTLSFPASEGNATQTVTVSTRNDGVVTSTLTFALGLSGATGGATIGTSPGTGTILEDATPPGTPASISPASQMVTVGYYYINWEPPTMGVPTYYELYQRQNLGSDVLVYSGSALTKQFGPVTQNAEYTYRVKACNAYGCSAMKGIARVTVCIAGFCD